MNQKNKTVKMNISQLKEAISEQKVICVTGRMAAGKNFICQKLEQNGWKSIDADILVHEAITRKTAEITETFREPAKEAGIDFTNSDGSINRRALGQLLFANPRLLAVQESIVYPEVTRLAEEFIISNPKAIINATVLYKTPALLEKCETIVFVTAPFLKRLKRARKRDRLPYRQILKRFSSQNNLLSCYEKNAAPKNIPVILIKNT